MLFGAGESESTILWTLSIVILGRSWRHLKNPHVLYNVANAGVTTKTVDKPTGDGSRKLTLNGSRLVARKAGFRMMHVLCTEPIFKGFCLLSKISVTVVSQTLGTCEGQDLINHELDYF